MLDALYNGHQQQVPYNGVIKDSHTCASFVATGHKHGLTHGWKTLHAGSDTRASGGTRAWTRPTQPTHQVALPMHQLAHQPMHQVAQHTQAA